MRSVVVTRFAETTDVMEVQEVPTPQPGEGQVRVAVRAAGVNYADIMQREGIYPGGPQPPYAAGFEIAGEIDAIGPGVAKWKVGDRVMGLCETGGYSDFVVTNAEALLEIPASLGFNEGAAVPCQYLTAYHALFTLANLQRGQTVLVQAAAGGLGTVLVQLAKLTGATAIGTCSTEAKCRLISELGCDYPINYKEKDFRKEVRKITGGAGCELVVESVGGRVFDLSLRCVKPLGRLIVLGMASKDPRPIYGAYLLPNNLTVSGFHLSAYLLNEKAMDRAVRDLHSWLEQGVLRFVVNHTYPLEEAAQAHEEISSRKTSGKVVLTV